MNLTIMATCHPDKLHHARGLCSACYQKEIKDVIRNGIPSKHLTTKSHKMSTCHPERDNCVGGLCKSCYEIKRRVNTGERKNAVNRANWLNKLKNRYGITPEQLEEIIIRQDGVCAICHSGKPTDVDHDHGTGKIRGVLCRKCNTGVGLFRESPVILKSAIEYILFWGKQ